MSFDGSQRYERVVQFGRNIFFLIKPYFSQLNLIPMFVFIFFLDPEKRNNTGVQARVSPCSLREACWDGCCVRRIPDSWGIDVLIFADRRCWFLNVDILYVIRASYRSKRTMPRVWNSLFVSSGQEEKCPARTNCGRRVFKPRVKCEHVVTWERIFKVTYQV